jgi:hypothetical protein
MGVGRLMFCRHDWEDPELLKVTPPMRPGTKITNASVELMAFVQKALWGFTTYTQTCKKCHKVRSYEVTGFPHPKRNNPLRSNHG